VTLTSNKVQERSAKALLRVAIGPKEIWLSALHISAFGGEADFVFRCNFQLLTQSGRLAGTHKLVNVRVGSANINNIPRLRQSLSLNTGKPGRQMMKQASKFAMVAGAAPISIMNDVAPVWRAQDRLAVAEYLSGLR
jgi:hypothetical protein